jgi:hypothetical protein
MSKISNGGFIKVTIVLIELMRKGDMIRCLFNKPEKLGDSQGG